MKLYGGNVLSHLKQCFKSKPADFPRNGKANYPLMLEGWLANLESNVFPYITASGIALDGGHLTFHDAEHIAKVEQVATSIITSDCVPNITPYELVFLLVAINLHDVGNVFGRAGHEERIPDLLQHIGTPTGFDAVETRAAISIARVHGGHIGESKDTISTLQDEIIVFSMRIRARMLAAILRLADELADDPARANKLQLAQGVIPSTSEIFHQYATHLHTLLAVPEKRLIQMKLEFSDPSILKRPMMKGTTQQFLMDEILERSFKTYREAKYCSRFLRPKLDFERVDVEILIFDGLGPQIEKIQYSLFERGYPSSSPTIYDLSPELHSFHGGTLSGESLAAALPSPPETV